VRLAADMQRLEFLRVVRHQPRELISTAGDLVGVQLSEPRGEP
jgi:rod shape-determining protein MreC